MSDNLKDDIKASLLSWPLRIRIASSLASVLNFLHRSHDPPVYHRDVKSANLVLCEGFVPKLIDCGLAKILSPKDAALQSQGKSVFTATAMGILGTPGYMCPKYSRGGQYGDKSEVVPFFLNVRIHLAQGSHYSTTAAGVQFRNRAT